MILICSILLIVSSIHAYPVGIEEWGHQGIGNTYQQVVYVETLPQEPLEYILSFPEVCYNSTWRDKQNVFSFY